MTDKVIQPHLTRHISSALLMSAMLLGVAACGSSTKASTATNAPAAAATTPAAAATTSAATQTSATGSTVPAGSVAVVESEFKISLPKLTMAPGTYNFAITNVGQFKHNLVIEGPGVDSTKSDTVEPGKTAQLSVTLQAGSYEFYCGIPTHKGKGMDLTVTVA